MLIQYKKIEVFCAQEVSIFSDELYYEAENSCFS